MRKPNRRKQMRTKFTQNQKESMFELAKRVGWKLRKQDEELIIEFCSKIGVEKGVFKVWLHNNKKKSSTSDVLPECLIQKILCLLSFKEAARMSVLSKTWLQAWSTLPNLEFAFDYRKGNVKVMDSIMERYRKGKIPIEKLVISDVPSIKLHPILAAKSLRELVLSDCDLMHVSLSSGVTNCISLRKLSLNKVNLDENMLHTLLNSCPLIVDFTFKCCSGLEKIELLNLRKIKSVSIRTHRHICQLVKIQAPTLEHMYYIGLLEELDVAECQNLKSLDLLYVIVSKGFLHNLISRLRSLKVLKIRDCYGIEEIDSSNLVSLEYIGHQIPQLKMARESSQLKHSEIVFKCDNDLNAAWFCKLRKFLSSSTSWSQVSLYFSECNVIDMKQYLQLHHKVATSQVDVLNVNIIRSSVNCSTFVDALLGSCHPRRFNLLATVEMNKCFIDCLMYMRNSSHSFSHESKPWHSQLIDVKAFYGKNQPLRLKNRELAISTPTEMKEVYFLLDWRCINE